MLTGRYGKPVFCRLSERYKIDISEFKGTDVELEIKDVYPGTERQDTCVAGIVLKRLRK